MMYDEEMMIADAVALFQSKLNAEITALNAEKADALILATIPNDKYVFETLDESMLNFTGFFIMYGIVDPGGIVVASQGSIIESFKMTFTVGTFDSGEAERRNTMKKLLRYRRALRTVVIKNPDVFRGYAKALLASLKPDAFPFGRNVVLTCGIDIGASINAG